MRKKVITEQGAVHLLLGAMSGKKTTEKEAILHEMRLELELLAKPLIKWLNDNYHPHTKIIIDTDSVEVVEGLMSIYMDEYIKG